MGWKLSMVIINTKQDFDKRKVFDALGYYNLEKSNTEYFDSIMNPRDHKIYLGKYNGNVIVCMQDLPDESMDEQPSNAELVLSKMFPKTDIATFVLHSVVNYWGYSIVKDGQKIRVRAGSADDGTFIEYGAVLEEEKELFSKAKLNAAGERVFIFEDMPEDEFFDDQVGENFVFELCAKYLGKNLSACHELFETQFEGYTFSKEKPSTQKWWKFW